MLKKVVFIVSLVWLTVQCGGSKKLPEGAPAKVKTSALFDSIERAENTPTVLIMKAAANLQAPGISQSFRLEVRILRDSLIWLDFADPILGIKAARAVIYPDSVAFINKIKREYLSGNIKTLQRKFNFSFNFYDLQAILSGNMVPKAYNRNALDQYPTVGAYQLADFPLNPKNQSDINPLQEQFTKLLLNSTNYKPTTQEQREPVNGKLYSLTYASFLQTGSITYPAKIKVEYVDGEQSILKLDVQDVETPTSTNFPFSIPNNYARIR